MKKILFVTLVSISFFAKAQTKEETKNWILQQTNSYPDKFYSYEFIGNFIGTKMEMLGNKTSTYILIDSIKSVSYKHDKTGLVFILKCNSNCGIYTFLDREYVEPSNTKPKTVRDKPDTKPVKGKTEEAVGSLLIYFAGEIDKSLIPRLEKAFLTLVQLHGGKAKLVPLKVKKEAF
jgi:hypothetical protein